ncbi:MAG TPA: SAM-dependent methyltransferase, partial [Oribacterium sp.]|nr:SAM-dependent methyltransferase [Oribacterium sp.]
MKNKTITYYDDPRNAYADLTVHADMSAIYARFQKYLTPGAAVLDAGCGSGRDSLHFMKMGYAVTAIDASKEMCAYASKLLQQDVRQLTFQELDYKEDFSGIWACASLLHVPERQQAEVLQRLIHALTPGGVLYASWKYGETERTEAISG